MNYYFYNKEIFTEQNLKRAKISTKNAILLTDKQVGNLITNVKDGYRRRQGTLEIEKIPEDPIDTTEIEVNWVSSEIESASIQYNYCADFDSRAVGTMGEWSAYRCALRDYTTKSTNKDGTVTYSVNDVSKKTYKINDITYSVTVNKETGRPMSPIDISKQ